MPTGSVSKNEARLSGGSRVSSVLLETPLAKKFWNVCRSIAPVLANMEMALSPRPNRYYLHVSGFV